jgi:hypothetical protein
VLVALAIAIAFTLKQTNSSPQFLPAWNEARSDSGSPAATGEVGPGNLDGASNLPTVFLFQTPACTLVNNIVLGSPTEQVVSIFSNFIYNLVPKSVVCFAAASRRLEWCSNSI